MKRIVLVEDDSSIVDIVRLILSENYLVESFPNGKVVGPLVNDPPQLYLIDLQLPGSINGTELCRLIKENEATRKVPVILFSAAPGLMNIAKAAGADDYLEKPFRIKSLRDCVKKHLKN